MKTSISKRFAALLATAAIVGFGNIFGVNTASADINVGALACQPPYLAQAGIIRWHEHYLVNPKGSFNTWVVCPIAFSTNDLPGPVYNIGAFGNVKPPKTDFNICYANVVDLRNQNIPLAVPADASNPGSPELPFLNNPGQNMTYVRQMVNNNDVGTLWYSYTTLATADIAAAMSPPPNIPGLGAGVNPAWWTFTVNCYLPAGYALNMVSLF
jgi:hypothetical protein